MNIQLQKVKSDNPDLFVQLTPEQEKLNDQLKQAGVSLWTMVLSCDPNAPGVEKVLREAIARVPGKEKEIRALSKRLREEVVRLDQNQGFSRMGNGDKA